MLYEKKKNKGAKCSELSVKSSSYDVYDKTKIFKSPVSKLRH